MLFKDRKDAGEQLAKLLEKYKNSKDTIILGLPRGGVVTAYIAAIRLHLPLDITCPRKIGAPFNPELAIGAITETGEGVLNEPFIVQMGISNEYLSQEIEKQKQIANHRLNTFRKGLPPRNLKGKNVIIIDDGLATGATMKAAIESVKKEQAKKVIVAIPVSPVDTLQEIEQLCDEVICLATPPSFQAVGQFYHNFTQTEDEEVLDLLKARSYEPP